MNKIFALALSGLGMMALGCANMGIDESEGVAVDPTEAVAEIGVVEMKAGAELAKLGVASYRVERADGATSVALKGTDGDVLGELAIYDPNGAMHMELSWQNHEDAFELDLRDGDAPLRIVTDDGVVSIRTDRKGEPEADAASLAVYEAVKPRWEVAAQVFKDLGIAQRRAETVKSESFSVVSGNEKKANPHDSPSPQAICGWCDNSHNCNFLGWSRWYVGVESGGWCVSGGSYCSPC
jgi:hypothetical protein